MGLYYHFTEICKVKKCLAFRGGSREIGGVSGREKMIGSRLRAFRELLQIPRSRFSVSVGFASERLAAYEAGRARLPYAVFQAIARRYDLHPRWLAEGTGSPQAKGAFDDADFMGQVRRHALFTDIYDRYLAKQLRRRTISADRSVEAEIDRLQKWIQFLNDETVPRAARARLAQKLRGPVEKLRQRLAQNAY